MKDKNTNLLIGKKLRQAREENNISIKDIANKVNVTRQTISNIENDTSMPSIALLCNICDVLNISIDYLLDWDVDNKIDIAGLNSEQRRVVYQIITIFKNQHENSNNRWWY